MKKREIHKKCIGCDYVIQPERNILEFFCKLHNDPKSRWSDGDDDSKICKDATQPHWNEGN